MACKRSGVQVPYPPFQNSILAGHSLHRRNPHILLAATKRLSFVPARASDDLAQGDGPMMPALARLERMLPDRSDSG